MSSAPMAAIEPLADLKKKTARRQVIVLIQSSTDGDLLVRLRNTELVTESQHFRAR